MNDYYLGQIINPIARQNLLEEKKNLKRKWVILRPQIQKDLPYRLKEGIEFIF